MALLLLLQELKYCLQSHNEPNNKKLELYQMLLVI